MGIVVSSRYEREKLDNGGWDVVYIATIQRCGPRPEEERTVLERDCSKSWAWSRLLKYRKHGHRQVISYEPAE